MTTIKSVCSVIALFFISTFAHSIPVDVVPEEESLSQSSVVPKERNWVMLENPISSDYQLSASSGKIQTPFGIFDPLAEEPPLGQWQAIGLQRPYDARLHIVQSISPDLFELQNELISIGIEIIDHIPDDSVVISLPEEASDSEISRVQNLSQVRWAGPMPSTWKVSKSLLALTQYGDSLIDLDVTPSPANSPQDLASLDALLNDLEGIEHETSQCDAHLCQIKSAKPSLITSLASAHRITRVEPGPVLSIQNSNASIISGVDLARDISGANLTGLGEVIGISDTGLDADHGDFDGRLRSPIFNLFGPDNSGADSNSGHGTHVTSTLLGLSLIHI